MVQNRFVIVKSIPRESALGLHKFADPTSGKLIKKNKVGEAIDILPVPYSRKRAALANYISYTPWYDETGKPKVDEKGQPLMLQDKYEMLHQKPKGYYHNMPVTGSQVKLEDRSFFQELKIRLNDGTTILDLNLPDDLMRYYVLLESRHVANSEKEWRAHKWPEARYYIAAENESEEIKYRKNEEQAKVLSYMFSDEMTNEVKRRVCVILHIANAKSQLSNEQMFNLIYSYITDGNKADNLRKFSNIYNLLKTEAGRQEFETRYILQEAIDFRIIYEKGASYVWPREKGNIILGDTIEEAIQWVNNPKKAVLAEELLNLISLKKKELDAHL